MDCITPSNPIKIEHGESIDIVQLLEKGVEAQLSLDPKINIDLSKYTYEPRTPVMQNMGAKTSNIHFLRAQSTKDDKELASIVRDYQRSQDMATDAEEEELPTPYKRPGRTPVKKDTGLNYGEKSTLGSEFGYVDSENHEGYLLAVLHDEESRKSPYGSSSPYKRSTPTKTTRKRGPYIGKIRDDLPKYD